MRKGLLDLSTKSIVIIILILVAFLALLMVTQRILEGTLTIR
ncbi:MAG TPA: hypothetical protein VJH22_00830 [Candidatus Nanoarchaeia archaeon]|nr:hypothetical protein [Candidatus Nanoarchaeia archaeon]